MHYHNIFYKIFEHLGVLVTALLDTKEEIYIYIIPQIEIHVIVCTWIVLLVLHFCANEYSICLTSQKFNQGKLET